MCFRATWMRFETQSSSSLAAKTAAFFLHPSLRSRNCGPYPFLSQRMDIDAQLSGYDFSSTFPLPFRVLFLSFSTLFAFATNLHLLAYLGIDTSLVLDIRLDDYRSTSTTSTSNNNNNNNNNNNSRTQTPFVHPSRLYPPIYGLAIVGLGWTAVGWMLFSWVTAGDPVQMVRWRGIPAFVALVVGGAAVAPINTLYRKERFMFLR